jgi:branched-chain amino acid transport system ATP-binding protein
VKPFVVRDLFRIIAGLGSRGCAILLVEQNARAALRVADHGYVLENGEVALSGPSGALAENDRVVETYLGIRHE